MGKPTMESLPKFAGDAASEFNNVVDHHVMEKLNSMGLLAGLSTQATHTGEQFSQSIVPGSKSSEIIR